MCPPPCCVVSTYESPNAGAYSERYSNPPQEISLRNTSRPYQQSESAIGVCADMTCVSSFSEKTETLRATLEEPTDCIRHTFNVSLG